MRKTQLVDCNPKWGTSDAQLVTRYITFDCPEGHDHCWHTIPFTPALEGGAQISTQANGAIWYRTGETFETLTLVPSIRRIPNRVDACAMHINITDGKIVFHADSK